MTSTYQTLKCLLDTRQRVRVLLHVGVKIAEIYAEVQTSMFLPNYHHSITLCTLTGPYGTWIQHFSQIIMNLFHQWQWNSSKSFFKLGFVSDFKYMFGWMRRHYGIQPKKIGWSPPTLVTRILIHRGQAPQTIFPAFASQSIGAFKGIRTHPPLPPYLSLQVALAPLLPPLL